MAHSIPDSKPRDMRLDFFRGLALLIIFIAHVPDNWLAQFRPASFGFSDSADIFVFVSGSAAAYAYGKVFRRAGFVAATARIVRRCAQLYMGHLGLFFAVVVFCIMGNRFLDTGINYINLLNLGYFFEHTQEAMFGLFSLTYVPNYFDILPMYMVALAMLPPLILFSRLHAVLMEFACIALYLAVPVFELALPAEIAFKRPWFFNPFAWQFLFYTGYFVGAGWIKAPPFRRWLTALCTVYLIASIPLSHYPTYSHVGWLKTLRIHLEPLVSKTDLGILRWLHFLCMAYVMVNLLKGREYVLNGKLAAAFIVTGQQALSVFLMGMALSQLAGMALDVWGRSILSTVIVNGVGIVVLILSAHVMAWFKSQPWRGTAVVKG